jgi:hypothetical protein
MDLQAIANGLATTIGTVVATNGTSTETATCTADLPDTVAATALLVYPPVDATLGLILGPKFDDHWLFMVRLLRDPLSVPQRTRWLYAWATALRPAAQAHYQLAVVGVMQAEARRMRVELDGERYSSASGGLQAFDVVEFEVDVHVQELTTVAL